MALGAHRGMLGAGVDDWGGPVTLARPLRRGQPAKIPARVLRQLVQERHKGRETNTYRIPALTSQNM